MKTKIRTIKRTLGMPKDVKYITRDKTTPHRNLADAWAYGKPGQDSDGNWYGTIDATMLCRVHAGDLKPGEIVRVI